MANPEQGMLTGSTPTVVIRPSRGWIPINLRDLWAYHELLYFLTWREIKARYKQTLLGFAWAIIQPLFMMIVFTMFFGTLGKSPRKEYPTPCSTTPPCSPVRSDVNSGHQTFHAASSPA